MKKQVLALMLISSASLALPLKDIVQDKPVSEVLYPLADTSINENHVNSQLANSPVDPFVIYKFMFQREASLNPEVANRAVKALRCANHHGIQYNDILTIIDYAKPSSEKRLWIFNLKDKKLLYHTYVSHGLKNGELWSNSFSNKHNSKASSIGLYLTQSAYRGREGISLRLDGLEQSFNNNANSRSIVMHGGWYVNENFIKKYARTGRSWGCPALPKLQVEEVIYTIKDNSLMLIDYPDDDWLSHSKFLNCQNTSNSYIPPVSTHAEIKTTPVAESEEAIVYADLKNKNRYAESNPVVTIKAQEYMHQFQRIAPLSRMLRRQINREEYIVLAPQELNQLIKIKADVNLLYFVIPIIKMDRGYYETTMHPINVGKLQNIISQNPGVFTANLEGKNKTLQFRIHKGFIRWIGL